MKTYIVQARFNKAGWLVDMGNFRAASHIGAITQAAKTLARNGEDAVELVATEKEA